MPDPQLAIAAFLASTAILLLASSSQRGEEEGRTVERFRRLLGVGASDARPRRLETRRARHWLERRLLRAGLEPSESQRRMAVVVLIGVALVGTVGRGPVGGLVLTLGAVGLALAAVEWLAQRRRRRILEQLPSFLEHVSRAVATGSSLQQAMELATREARDPLRSVFEGIERLVRLGATLGEAFDRSASVYDLRELDMLSLTLRVSIEYGGGVRQTLAGIVTAIRQREQAERELRALTGETRLSAWILGALPPLVGLFVSTVNPAYLGNMWNDPGGRTILWACFGLQGIGSLLLWRMVRSIG